MSQAACRKNPMCVTLSDFFGSVFVMNSVRQFPLHALLLLPALLLMLDGLWAGLQRMGWALPHLHPNLAALHGPLMLAGFLGTLIALERAVALPHPRHYSVKTTPTFAALKAELTEAVREEVLATQRLAQQGRYG